MSDNIFVLQESSSEYETTSSEEEEEVKVVKTDNMKFYEHTNYVDNTLKILPVVIDVNRSDLTPTSGGTEIKHINFSVSFDDSIIIHKLCDVYLDNLVTYNCKTNSDTSTNHICFILDIKELDINTKSSKANMKNKIVIPNGNTGGENTVTTHRSKKLNYISTVQPKKINTFTGSITILDETNIWHASETTNGRFTLELNFIFRN